LKERARSRLIERLESMLPPARDGSVDASGRTELFEDNLVASLEPAQIAELKRQLAKGDGGELEPGPHGQRPDAHAAHSSEALAFNAFGRWLGYERQLTIDGIGGFDERIRVEAKQPIFKGGRAPNLDCLASGPKVVVGVESKLTEPLAPHTHRKWSLAYERESCQSLLSAGWVQALKEAIAGTYAPRYLDTDQLLKHALGLSKQHPDVERHLVYVYWEPTDGDQFDVAQEHRAELAAFQERVGDASPHFHAVTHAQLWDEWAALRDIPWLPDHLRQLRDRYAIGIN
jgi:hypothetical protein